MDRLTDTAQGYCEMYCKKYGRCFAEPETCEHKAEVAMYEKLKEIEGIVPFDRLLELAVSDRAGRCIILPIVKISEQASFAESLKDVFDEWMQDDPSVGISPMSEGENAIAKAIMIGLEGNCTKK